MEFHEQKSVIFGDMEHPNFKQAHPVAQQLMDEDFFYSPIEESGPFGSDDGADTFAGFAAWRSANSDQRALTYLEQQLDEWGYPPFDLHERDPEEIQHYMRENELGLPFLVGMDAAVIAVAFAQLYLEGMMEEELRRLAKTSLDRQLHHALIELWDESYRPTRQEQLSKMLSVVNRL